MNSSILPILNIIRAVVCESGEEIPIGIDWEAIWHFAMANHLEAIVFSAAKSRTDVPKELKTRMSTAFYAAVAHDVQQRSAVCLVEQAMSDSGIPYAPMKGCVLKGDYPASYLRFMCDADFYVRAADRERIRRCMDTIDACRTGESAGDDIYVVAGRTGFEPQSMLYYRLERGQIVHYSDWSAVDEKYNKLKEEGFALNLIGHCVGDMRKGGPGLRYVLDLWVYRHRHQSQPDWDFVNERMRRDGILNAAQNLLDLSEYLFGGGEVSPLMEEMADYVMSTSLYGDSVRARATEVALSGGRRGAFVHQLLRDREDYENRYAWLANRHWLLPVAVVLRAFHILRVHPRVVSGWLHGTRSVSRAQAREQRERLSRFGL